MSNFAENFIIDKNTELSKIIQKSYLYYVIVVSGAALQMIIIGIPVSYIAYSFITVLFATIIIIILKLSHVKHQFFTNKIYLFMLFLIGLTLSFYYKDLQLTLLIGNSFLIFNFILLNQKMATVILSILLVNIINLSYIIFYPNSANNFIVFIIFIIFIIIIALESRILINQMNKIMSKYIAEKRNRKKIENVNRDKDEFISTISHELRSPMTAIRGYLQLLNIEKDYEKLPKETLSEIENLYTDTENLNKLIDNLLNSSRIDLGRLYINKANYTINTIIIKAIDRIIQNANRKNIRIKLNSKTNNITINTDPEKLQDIIVNLLDNAIKYSKEFSVIHIEANIKNQKINIKIKDHGIGITKDKINSLFDKNYSDNSKKIGLGLYISKNFANLIGGDIFIESRENHGTTAIVEI